MENSDIKTFNEMVEEINKNRFKYEFLDKLNNSNYMQIIYSIYILEKPLKPSRIQKETGISKNNIGSELRCLNTNEYISKIDKKWTLEKKSEEFVEKYEKIKEMYL